MHFLGSTQNSQHHKNLLVVHKRLQKSKDNNDLHSKLETKRFYYTKKIAQLVDSNTKLENSKLDLQMQVSAWMCISYNGESCKNYVSLHN